MAKKRRNVTILDLDGIVTENGIKETVMNEVKDPNAGENDITIKLREM